MRTRITELIASLDSPGSAAWEVSWIPIQKESNAYPHPYYQDGNKKVPVDVKGCVWDRIRWPQLRLRDDVCVADVLPQPADLVPGGEDPGQHLPLPPAPCHTFQVPESAIIPQSGKGFIRVQIRYRNSRKSWVHGIRKDPKPDLFFVRIRIPACEWPKIKRKKKILQILQQILNFLCLGSNSVTDPDPYHSLDPEPYLK